MDTTLRSSEINIPKPIKIIGGVTLLNMGTLILAVFLQKGLHALFHTSPQAFGQPVVDHICGFTIIASLFWLLGLVGSVIATAWYFSENYN